MRLSTHPSACLLLLAAAGPAMAVDVAMSPQGYTGLSITPSAHLLGWGEMSLAYDRQLPGARRPDGHNFIAGFGLLPHLEISGRIATNTIHCNGFTQSNCGIRDLSANVKAGIGLGDDNQFGLAVGGTDLGGIATNFRSYYGVGTYDSGNTQLSLGYANRSAVRGSAQSPLHGVFGSVAYQPLSWLQGHLEYADRNAWAGAKVFAPNGWMPRGWKAYAGVNARLTDDTVTERTWWNLGVTIPLYHVPDVPGSGRKATSAAAVDAAPTAAPVAAPGHAATRAAAAPREVTPVTIAPPTVAPPTVAPPTVAPPTVAPVAAAPTAQSAPGTPPPLALPPTVSDSHLQALAARLKAKGLEDISIGRLRDGTVAIAVNNATYNWNVVDSLGVSMGVVARDLAFARIGYRLILTQRQTPIVAVSGQTDCLQQWIDGTDVNCTAAELFTPGTLALERLHDGVVWVVRDAAASWRTLRVGLQPVLASNVATEYGVFDYSVGLGVNLQQPLWDGASIDVRYVTPLDNSSDFEPDAAFGARRVREGVDRALISQTLRLPLERWSAGGAAIRRDAGWGLSAVTAQLSLGKVSRVYNGVHGELRWEPGEGRHRFGAEAGRFKHKDKIVGPVYGPALVEPRTAKPVLGSYRYHHVPTETFLEVTAGRFLNHDRGVQLALRQWFADTAVAVYYKRTRFDYQPDSASFVGLEISFPLGPRKDLSPGSFIQVRGTPRWAYGVETLTGGVNNNITTGHAVRPGLSVLNNTFNSDRSGVLYFEKNLGRIRDAAR